MRTSLCRDVLDVFLQCRTHALILLLALAFGVASPSCADTRMVNVGPGSTHSFQDTVSGTSTTVIRKGDPVQWNWISGFHSTTSGTCSGACTSSGIWDSTAKSSGTFSFTFNQVGTFPYYCSVHLASMTGVVIVRPAPGPFALQVAPSGFSLVPTKTLQFSASRVFFRGAASQSAFSENITNQVQWSSSNTSIATVNPSSGLVTAGSTQGPVTITASKGPLSASVQLTVSSTVVLNSITVTPGNQHKLLGSGTVTYTATGNFSDGSTQDLTGTVTWASSVPGVATMTNNVATLVAAGTTAISATSTAGPTVTGSTILQVVVLRSITVTPSPQPPVVNAAPVPS